MLRLVFESLILLNIFLELAQCFWTVRTILQGLRKGNKLMYYHLYRFLLNNAKERVVRQVWFIDVEVLNSQR